MPNRTTCNHTKVCLSTMTQKISAKEEKSQKSWPGSWFKHLEKYTGLRSPLPSATNRFHAKTGWPKPSRTPSCQTRLQPPPCCVKICGTGRSLLAAQAFGSGSSAVIHCVHWDLGRQNETAFSDVTIFDFAIFTLEAVWLRIYMCAGSATSNTANCVCQELYFDDYCIREMCLAICRLNSVQIAHVALFSCSDKSHTIVLFFLQFGMTFSFSIKKSRSGVKFTCSLMSSFKGRKLVSLWLEG